MTMLAQELIAIARIIATIVSIVHPIAIALETASHVGEKISDFICFLIPFLREERR